MLNKKWVLLDRKTENYKRHSYTVILENASSEDEDGESHWTSSGYSWEDTVADNHPYYNTAPTKEVMQYLVGLHNKYLEEQHETPLCKN